MEYVQWKVWGHSKPHKEQSEIEIKADEGKATHYVMLRFTPDERNVENFDKMFEKGAESLGFEYKIEDKGEPDLIVKGSVNVMSKAKFHSEDLNTCLNTTMKMFEIYLTVINK